MTAPERLSEAITADSRPVLVPLDGSAVAEQAVPWATDIAERRHAPLLLVRAISPRVTATPGGWTGTDSDLYQDVMAAEENEAHRYLEKQAEMLGLVAPGLPVRRAVPMGDPAEAVLQVVAAQRALLIVLTTRGRTGLERWVRGSVAEKVLRYGTVPLLLIQPREYKTPTASERWRSRRVLVPLDGSALAEYVLPGAARLAAEIGGEIVLASVVRPGHDQSSRLPRPATASRNRAQTYLRGVARSLRQQGTSVCSVVLVATDVVRALTEHTLTDGADVIAMSTHGRGGVGRLLYGSVADQIAHRATVPVLLVRPAPVADTNAVKWANVDVGELVAPQAVNGAEG